MRRTTACLSTLCLTLTAMFAGLSTAWPARAQDVHAVSLAYNTSGLELLQRLAASPGNIVLSPYSIGTAMAMARSGARGETEAEMARVLQHRLDRAGTEVANAKLLSLLDGYDKSAVAPGCEQGLRWTGRHCEAPATATGRCPATARREGEGCVAEPIFRPASAKLLVANALLLLAAGKKDVVSADYQRLIETCYRGEVLAQVGLEPIGVDQVNAWVASKTEGKIPRMLDRLDRNSAAVLLNAIYFKAHWAQLFAKAATKNDAFYVKAAQQIDVPMMRETGRFALVARPGYRAIRLPYDVPALSMIIALPERREGLAELVERFDARELAALGAELIPAHAKLVALALPRFKASSMANLIGPFSQLGMRAAFDRQAADFSGITGRPPAQRRLVIDQIVHRAVIDVMEEGTEAAAATAVVIAEAAAARPPKPEEPEPFVVDHPFLFLIVERASGAVLFAGRIVDPR
jgi:serpin B